jgi:hypothetical protein
MRAVQFNTIKTGLNCAAVAPKSWITHQKFRHDLAGWLVPRD